MHLLPLELDNRDLQPATRHFICERSQPLCCSREEGVANYVTPPTASQSGKGDSGSAKLQCGSIDCVNECWSCAVKLVESAVRHRIAHS